MTSHLLLLTALQLACSTREIEQPHPPPAPPTAALWPLGGKIYYGTPLPTPTPPAPDGSAPTDGDGTATPPSAEDIVLTDDPALTTGELVEAEGTPDSTGTPAPPTEDPDASEPAPGDP